MKDRRHLGKGREMGSGVVKSSGNQQPEGEGKREKDNVSPSVLGGSERNEAYSLVPLRGEV